MTRGDDRHNEERFSRVFATNLWLDDESLSGPGSRRGSFPVVAAVEALEYAFRTFGIVSLSDVPCGDLNWMAPFIRAHPGVSYHGYDIVAPLIARNAREHPDLACTHLDALRAPLPATDLIFTKDLLIHLEIEDVDTLLRNFVRSGSRFVLATNNFGLGNSDLMQGQHGDSACRYVDIIDAPFGYPPPIWRNDLFGLWACEDLSRHIEQERGVHAR